MMMMMMGLVTAMYSYVLNKIDNHGWSCTPRFLEVVGKSREEFVISKRYWWIQQLAFMFIIIIIITKNTVTYK
jgi:hypothetical protein